MPTASRILTIFTRTPLHVGAGASVGAIDQPIIRERHTGFPIIPGSSLKGSFADLWNSTLDSDGKRALGEAAWLFGSDDARDSQAAAGALLFGEARLIAFPIRSARGSYAWMTSPLLLRRAVRDGVITEDAIGNLTEPPDDSLLCATGTIDFAALNGNPPRVVLEEYTYTRAGDLPQGLAPSLAALAPNDPVWANAGNRIAVLSDGQMSHFARTACEVAQHVRISDETGTAAPGGLFNQENVPSETMFYSVIRAQSSRLRNSAYASSPHREKTAEDAINAFAAKIASSSVTQFGGDASTGLGFCTVALRETSSH